MAPRIVLTARIVWSSECLKNDAGSDSPAITTLCRRNCAIVCAEARRAAKAATRQFNFVLSVGRLKEDGKGRNPFRSSWLAHAVCQPQALGGIFSDAAQIVNPV